MRGKEKSSGNEESRQLRSLLSSRFACLPALCAAPFLALGLLQERGKHHSATWALGSSHIHIYMYSRIFHVLTACLCCICFSTSSIRTFVCFAVVLLIYGNATMTIQTLTNTPVRMEIKTSVFGGKQVISSSLHASFWASQMRCRYTSYTSHQ